MTDCRTTKNRWNAQRVAERIPLAELETKMTSLRLEQEQGRRSRRRDQSSLWDFLYRSECELQRSIARRHSLDDIGNIKATILRQMTVAEPVSTAESFRRFQEFQALTSVRLQLTDSNPFPALGHRRPSYALLRRSVDQQAAARNGNELSFERIVSGSYCSDFTDRQLETSSSIAAATVASKTPPVLVGKAMSRAGSEHVTPVDGPPCINDVRVTPESGPPTRTASGVYLKRPQPLTADNELVEDAGRDDVADRTLALDSQTAELQLHRQRHNTVLLPIVRTSPAASVDSSGKVAEQTASSVSRSTPSRLQLPCIAERSSTS